MGSGGGPGNFWGQYLRLIAIRFYLQADNYGCDSRHSISVTCERCARLPRHRSALACLRYPRIQETSQDSNFKFRKTSSWLM